MDSPTTNHNPSQENGSLPDLTEHMVDIKCEGSANAVNNEIQTVNDVLVSTAVAEFKGPEIFRIVRLAQVSMELARIEASFSGLSPGIHGWSINEFGDLTRGVASTGKMFNPSKEGTDKEPLGYLGTLDVDKNGEAFYSGVKQQLGVTDLIGRSIAVYETEDKSDLGLTAAVIGRTAGIGENCKKICACNGTTIWEASDKDLCHL